MDKKNIILWASVAGGAALAYWYITHYGPHGKLTDVGGPSYWDTWFGSHPAGAIATPAGYVATAPPAGYLPAGVPATQTQQPNQQPPPVQTQQQPPVSAGTQVNNTLRAQLISAGGEAPKNADQWNYYYSAVSGVNQTTDLFPADNRGYLMSVDEYLSRRAAAGLSGMGDIVQVSSVPSVPSMSFGGSRAPGRGFGNAGFNGGGYVQ